MLFNGFCQHGLHPVKDDTSEVFAELDVLVNNTQFQTLVPDTTVFIHLDPGAVMLYESTVVPVSALHGCTSHPNLVVKWVPPSRFNRLDTYRLVFHCDNT